MAALVAAAGSWVPALWSDEVATVSAAGRNLPDLLRLVDRIDAVHAVYYLLLHGWMEVAGTSAFALRLPSALAVGFAAAGLYVLARRLLTPRAALLAAGVFAVLPRVTWAGAEARPYALTIAVAVWLSVALYAGVARSGRARRRLLVGYAALVAVATAVNVYLLLLVVAHAVTLLVRRETWPAFRPFAVAAAGGVAVAGPLLALVLGQSGQLGERERGPLRLLVHVLVNQWFLGGTPTPTSHSGSLAGAWSVPGSWKIAALLLAAVGWTLIAWLLVRTLRAAAPAPERVALLAWTVPWLLVPTVLLLAGSVASPSLYNARYLGFCAPAVAMLIAAALAERPRRALAGGLVLVLLTVPIYASQRTTSAKSGSDWALVAEHLQARTQAGDGVYFEPRELIIEGIAHRSLRSISLGYPQPFDGLIDVTLLHGPAAGGTLFGTSRPLAESTDRLGMVDTLWVLRRQGRPAEAHAEDRLLADLGYRVVEVWEGPQTRVLKLLR